MKEEIEIKNLDHLGLVAGIIDDLEIENIVDSLIQKDIREKVSAGKIVKAIILNGLGFLSRPLYLFPEFFQDKPVEKLLGAGIKAEEINDDKIGRVMDQLHQLSLELLWVKIGINTINKFEIKTKYSHLDSSSISVEGKYKEISDSENIIKITQGYSRDHRPDLPQFMIDLMASSDGDIPLFMRIGSGNESDKTIFPKVIKTYQNQFQLSTIFVADSALFTAKNLHDMKGLSWITRVPLSIKEELSSEEILEEYKKQQCCERGFRFLKDPLFLTSSVFVKNPKRVEVMGMLMGLCLLVYTMGQRMIRKEIEKRKIGIKNQVNKLTNNPTMRWIFQLFQGIHYVLIDGKECISNLKEERKEILSYFSINCQKYY